MTNDGTMMVAQGLYETAILATGRALSREYANALVAGPATMGCYPCHANVVARLVAQGYVEERLYGALRRLVMDPTTNCPGVVERGA
ncbi:MAG: hypothetical protein M3Q55_09300 [Acidobacteriota bacterium]|nr:hypothetical protein [Acidobacteriota bacterium]